MEERTHGVVRGPMELFGGDEKVRQVGFLMPIQPPAFLSFNGFLCLCTVTALSFKGDVVER